MALSFGLIISSYAQEKVPQMRERKMNDSCKMMSPQDNHKMNVERKDFNKNFYSRPQQMRHGMRNFEGRDFENQGQRNGKMEGKKMEHPMMNRPTEGRPEEHQMYMRDRRMRGNMYHNFPPKPEQKIEIEKKAVEPAKFRKGPSVEFDESALSMEDFINYINYKS